LAVLYPNKDIYKRLIELYKETNRVSIAATEPWCSKLNTFLISVSFEQILDKLSSEYFELMTFTLQKAIETNTKEIFHDILQEND